MSQRPYKDYLAAPPAFWTCPPEVKKACCNGAGPKGLVGWFVPDRIYGVSITEAANIHDWMYTWAELDVDKEIADLTFLCNCIEIINECTTSISVLRFIMLHLRHRVCIDYYEAVEELGVSAFKNAFRDRPPGYVNPDLEVKNAVAKSETKGKE